MFKKVVLWLHKWLGIITGIVVFILSVTGCFYTFHDDLKLLVYPQKYIIQQQIDQASPLPLSELLHIAQGALGQEERVSRVDLYPAPDRTWVFRAQETDESAFGYWNYYVYYKRIFVNPYTGEVAAIENSKTEFFQLMLQMHLHLLLGKKYGHPVVGYSTAIFVLLLLSGIILWWPKKWKGKTLKRAIWLKTKVKWKRFNYDLHNVLGFYSFLLALILAITGLVFSFPEFKKGYTSFLNNFSTNDHAQIAQLKPLTSIDSMYTDPLDNALHYALAKHSRAGMMSIRLRSIEAPTVDIQIRHLEQRSGLFEWYYFNKKDLRIKEIKSSKSLAAGDKIASLNYDIHTGNIRGMLTKILAFFISLICASLPVTGYIIWWNKSRKIS
ncbi:PepSY domain-containing protein [Sphingobacterium alkalisoli]|uniref:PepSY domain-containing protein n=1 Tax=Sphingobacterium alkalisoli TaxID=1874115 RepID=A0A4U0GY29_9SPHI|nr:PepSY-associated TM helix domain-containing protein [Sphingobacterium alkalisoli]TJY63988.1 PepSY domain-containing protein [Sphingobacterium alkalisoli]